MVPVAERLYTAPITAQFGVRVTHEVTDEAFAAGQRASEYEALCGCVFIPAPMVVPVGPPCPSCVAILAASRRVATLVAARQPRHRRHGLLRRMFLGQVG